jgi:DNA modification methylase
MLNQIVCGDARLLAPSIPDGSVDLIFTDPVYEQIDDYRWLAEQATRVLKPNGSVLVWCSNRGQYAVQPVMSEYLTFALPLSYTKIGNTYRSFAYRTFFWSTPCLWFVNGNGKNHDWIFSTIVDHDNAIVTTTAPPTDTYKWHKNPEAYSKWLCAFTNPGDLVWDPFTGSGSLPILCKELGRQFYASEIQADVAAMAQARLLATPEPLPGMDVAEQSVMALAHAS